MKTFIYLSDYVKPAGTYRSPMLDIEINNVDKKVGGETYTIAQDVSFYEKDYVKELYDRYKYDITYDIFGLQDEKDVYENMITINDFLQSDHILILLGCLEGEGHEVLYS